MTNRADSSQQPTLVVYDGTPAAKLVQTAQLPVLTAYAGVSNPKTSQQPTLVVYNTGSRENFTLRAWSFVLDGNWFYVLHLGLQGTWVYVVSSDTWAEWQTLGFDNWNAEQGLVWNSRIVAGDNQNPILWEVNPETQLDDDFRPIVHKSTAIIYASGRESITVGALYVTAAVGAPASLDPVVSLRFSDDQGVTWVDMEACNVTLTPDAFSQEIAFRSLGRFGAPGRVFEISDYGGTVRVDRASIITNQKGGDRG